MLVTFLFDRPYTFPALTPVKKRNKGGQKDIKGNKEGNLIEGRQTVNSFKGGSKKELVWIPITDSRGDRDNRLERKGAIGVKEKRETLVPEAWAESFSSWCQNVFLRACGQTGIKDWMAPHTHACRLGSMASKKKKISVWFYNVTVSQRLHSPWFCVTEQAGYFPPVFRVPWVGVEITNTSVYLWSKVRLSAVLLVKTWNRSQPVQLYTLFFLSVLLFLLFISVPIRFHRQRVPAIN